MIRLLQLGSCLADPLIVRTLLCLLSEEFSVRDLQRILRVNRSRLQPRLTLLRECGLVEVERIGRFLIFKVANDRRKLIQAVLEDHRDDLTWDPDVSKDESVLRSNGRALSIVSSMVWLATVFDDVIAAACFN